MVSISCIQDNLHDWMTPMNCPVVVQDGYTSVGPIALVILLIWSAEKQSRGWYELQTPSGTNFDQFDLAYSARWENILIRAYHTTPKQTLEGLSIILAARCSHEEALNLALHHACMTKCHLPVARLNAVSYLYIWGSSIVTGRPNTVLEWIYSPFLRWGTDMEALNQDTPTSGTGMPICSSVSLG